MLKNDLVIGFAMGSTATLAGLGNVGSEATGIPGIGYGDWRPKDFFYGPELISDA